MKKCNVAILGFRSIPIHRFIASSLIDSLDKTRGPGERYAPHVLMADDETIESVRNVLLEHKDTKCDIIVSVGLKMTLMLKGLYKETEIGEIPTVFWGVPNADTLGLVDSLQRPGGCMSGVAMAEPSAVRHAEFLKVFQPYMRKIFIPYDPTALGGAVFKRVQQLSAELIRIGFTVTTQAISSSKEAYAQVVEHLPNTHAVLLMEGCVALDAERDISNVCAIAGRFFLSSGTKSSIDIGAVFVYGCPIGALAPEVIAMVRRFWRDRKLLGMQPVVIVPDKRVGAVNTFMFGLLIPQELLKALFACSGLMVEWRWVMPPVVVPPEPEIWDPEE